MCIEGYSYHFRDQLLAVTLKYPLRRNKLNILLLKIEYEANSNTEI